MSRKAFLRLMAALYAVALAACLAVRTVGWCGLRRCEARPLEAALAEQVSIFDDRTWASFGPGSLLSTNGDAQLIWTLDAPVSGLQMTVRSSKPVMEPELYYTTAPRQDFSLERRLAPVKSDPVAGVYVFRLPRATQVHRLRLDPTSAGGAFFTLQVQLNPPVAVGEWFAPSAAELLALAFGPALAALAVREIGLALKKRT